MITLLRFVPALLFACATPALSKCAVGVITFEGETTTAVQGPIKLTVTLITPKGHVMRLALIVERRFTFEAAFNTFSSSFMPFWTEHCNNRPKGVVITAELNGKRLGQNDLKLNPDLKKDAIPTGPRGVLAPQKLDIWRAFWGVAEGGRSSQKWHDPYDGPSRAH